MAKILFVLFCIFTINCAEDVKKDLNSDKRTVGDKNWPKPVGPAIGDIPDGEDSDTDWFPNIGSITKPDLDIEHPWNKPKPDNSLPNSAPWDPAKDKPWVPSINTDLNKPSSSWVPGVDTDLNKPLGNKPSNGKPWNKPTTREPWVDVDETSKKPWGHESDVWNGNKPWSNNPEDWNPVKPWNSKPPNQWKPEKPEKPNDEDVYIEEVGDEEYEHEGGSGDEEEPVDSDDPWEQVNPQKRPHPSTSGPYNPIKKPPQPFYPETKPDQIGKPQQGKPWNKPGAPGKPGKPGNSASDPWSEYPAWADQGPISKPKPQPPKPSIEDMDDHNAYPYQGLAHKPDNKPKSVPRKPYYTPGQSSLPWHKNNQESSETKDKIDLYKQPINSEDKKAEQSSGSTR